MTRDTTNDHPPAERSTRPVPILHDTFPLACQAFWGELSDLEFAFPAQPAPAGGQHLVLVARRDDRAAPEHAPPSGRAAPRLRLITDLD